MTSQFRYILDVVERFVNPSNVVFVEFIREHEVICCFGSGVNSCVLCIGMI